jgi:IPT/TIG domain-containing protein
MIALVMIFCMPAAMFWPMLVVVNSVLIFVVPENGARSTSTLIAAMEREVRLPTMAQSDWTSKFQRETQSRSELARRVAPPAIAALSPTSGPFGTLVTIRGAHFTSKNLIQFHGARASFAAGSPVSSGNGTTLRFRVSTCPSYEPQCPGFYVPPGVYKVAVVNANGASNETTFALTSR